MNPRQNKERIWCTWRANTRTTRNKARTVEFKPPLKEHLVLSGDDTKNKLNAIDKENNEIHFRVKQTTQMRKLKKIYRLAAVVQVKPEEDVQV